MASVGEDVRGSASAAENRSAWLAGGEGIEVVVIAGALAQTLVEDANASTSTPSRTHHASSFPPLIFLPQAPA